MKKTSILRIFPESLLILAFVLLSATPSTAQVPRSQGPSGSFTGLPADSQSVQLPPPSPEVLRLWHHFYVAAELQGRDDSQVPGDAYLAILELWAEKISPDALLLLTEFETRQARVRACFQQETHNTITGIELVDPEAVLAAVLLHIHAWQSDLENRRFGYLRTGLERIRRWTKSSVKARGRSPESRREAALLLVYLAEVLRDSGYANLLIYAEQILDDAVDLDPEAVTARYLRSMISEKMSRYRKTLDDMEALHERLPGQGDVTLRLAIQLSRLEKHDRAAELFADLLDASEVEPWVRAVAFQEWVRLELSRERPARAREVLDRARREIPENARLAIQEVELNRRERRAASSLSNVVLESPTASEGLTPRWRYLQGPLPELDANRRALNDTVLRSASRLAAAIQERKQKDRGMSSDCLGVWRRLVPRGGSEEAKPVGTTASAGEDLFRSAPLVPSESVPPPLRIATSGEIRAPESSEPVKEETKQQVYVDPESGERIIVHDALDLDLRTFYLSPTTRLGRRVTDLRREEIVVSDAGVKQEIVTFAQGGIPFTATVLLDGSGSMQGARLLRALEGVHAFTSDMGPNDRARLVIASDRLRGVSPFVSVEDASLDHLTTYLDTAVAEGGTALFDYLFLTLDALRSEVGRKVVIVLSDGFDLMSAVEMSSVLEIVRRNQIQLYWVRLREGVSTTGFVPPTGWRKASKTIDEIERLERAVRVSGGRVIDVGGPDEAPEAFAWIVAELRAQVAVGYYANPTPKGGQWREVDIEAKRSGVRLRHAAGYFAE